MPAADLMTAFALATLVFGYMPGPGMLYAVARTMAGGRRAGWMATLGLHLGGYVHVIAAAFGLALLFQAVPVMHLALKMIGAVYLIWLGLGLLCGAAKIEILGKAAREPAFSQSIIVEVLNPKTALFYLAFLPQFTDASAALPIWGQLLVLGTIVNVVFSSADVMCVLLADRVMRLVQRSQTAGRWVRRLGGGILIGLGLSLGLGRN